MRWGSEHVYIMTTKQNFRLALETKHSEPAQFYFCSSISVVFSWPGPGQIPEDVFDDPRFAQQTGYARSKVSVSRKCAVRADKRIAYQFKKKINNNFQWVVERLCKIASESSSLHARVLRIGQLVGDTQNGIWNESEAVSLIIKVRELCFRGCTGVQNRVGCTNNPSPTSSKGGMTVPSRDWFNMMISYVPVSSMASCWYRCKGNSWSDILCRPRLRRRRILLAYCTAKTRAMVRNSGLFRSGWTCLQTPPTKGMVRLLA